MCLRVREVQGHARTHKPPLPAPCAALCTGRLHSVCASRGREFLPRVSSLDLNSALAQNTNACTLGCTADTSPSLSPPCNVIAFFRDYAAHLHSYARNQVAKKARSLWNGQQHGYTHHSHSALTNNCVITHHILHLLFRTALANTSCTRSLFRFEHFLVDVISVTNKQLSSSQSCRLEKNPRSRRRICRRWFVSAERRTVTHTWLCVTLTRPRHTGVHTCALMSGSEHGRRSG